MTWTETMERIAAHYAAMAMQPGCWQTRKDLGRIHAQSTAYRQGKRTCEVAVTQTIVLPLLKRFQLAGRHLDLTGKLRQREPLRLTSPTQQVT